MEIKHGSLKETDEAIHYFNECLKRRRDISVTFRKGISCYTQVNGISILFETVATSENSPINVELDSYALYSFDRGGLPTQRMAPSVFDVRDYFARSILKRPKYVNLVLDVRRPYKNKEPTTDELVDVKLGKEPSVFSARFNVGYRYSKVLTIKLPEEQGELIERYKRSIEDLTIGKNFRKVIDLAFRIQDETPWPKQSSGETKEGELKDG